MSLEEILIDEPQPSFELPAGQPRPRAAPASTHHTNGTSVSADDLNEIAAPAQSIASASVESATVARSSSWFDRFLATFSGGTMLRKSVLALADQGIVSAVNFLTIVLLRRTTTGSQEAADHQLGLYQLGFTIVLLAMCTQNALICTPYAVFGNSMRGLQRRRYAGSTLVHQSLLSIIFALGLMAVGIGLVSGLGIADFGVIAMVLAAMTPFILVREFVRRLAFVHLQVITVLVLDIIVAILQLGGLVALKSFGQLTATTAFCTIGLSCALAGLTVLWLLRGLFSLRQTKSWSDLQMSWSFGRWAFAAQLVYLGMAYAPTWLLAIFAGPQATGRFAVSWSLIMIANPILIGLYNYLGPQAIYAYHADGLAALRKLTVRIGIIITLIVSGIYAFLLLFGGTLLAVFFGDKLRGQEHVVSVLALGIVMQALSISAENGLTALNRPTAIFVANAVALLVSLVASCLLISPYGVMGAAYAALMAAVAVAVVKIGWFARVSRASVPGAN